MTPWSTSIKNASVASNSEFRALLSRNPEYADRFPVDPRSVSDLRALSTRVLNARFERNAVATALDEFNGVCGADSTALSNVALLRDPRTLVVATGQQPGFAGGALFLVYKALTAVALAKHWSATLETPVVPVFWIAGDDHDLSEMERVGWFDAPGQNAIWHRAALGPTGLPIADIRVDDSHVTAASQLVQAARDTTTNSDPMDPRFAPRVGEYWTHWFGRILATLTAGTGLVLLDPAALSSHSFSFLEKSIASPTRTVHALHTARIHLGSRFGDAPLRDDVPSSVFLTLDGRRQRFDPRTHTAADVERARRSSRAGVSGDAALRAVTQSALLPVLGVVGGPGELRYWCQLKEVFDANEIEFPAFVPRFRGAVILPAIRKHLESLRLPEDEWLDTESDVARRIKSEPVVDSEAWLVEKDRIVSAFESLRGRLDTLGGNVPARTKQAREGLENSLTRILDVAAARVRETHGNYLARRRAVAVSLMPFGRHQERSISSLAFGVRFDPSCFARLAERIDPLSAQFSWIEIS